MNKAILGIFVFAFLLFNNCTKSLGQGTKAGDLLEVPLAINNQQTVMNFRYCEPGDMPLNAPWEDQSKAESPYSSRGFYVLESELDANTLGVLLGDKGLESSVQYLQKLHSDLPDAGYQDFLEGHNTKSQDIPVLFLTLENLISLCDTLDKESTSQNLPPDTIEGRTFRLLSVSEWRKAALGDLYSQIPTNNTLYYVYPEPTKLDKGIKRRFESAMTTAGKNATFQGRKNDFFDALSMTYNKSSRRLANEALRLFFSQAILPKTTPEDLSRAFTYPVKVKYSEPNSIGLYDLLSGLPEWTIIGDSEDLVAEKWLELKNAFIQGGGDTVEQIQLALTLCGGSFIRPLTAPTNDNYDWMTTTIWGGPKMNQGELRPFMLSSFDASTKDLHAGVRLGLFRSIRPGWFEVVRESFVSTDDITEAFVNRNYQGNSTTLKQLGTSTDLEVIEPVLKFYRAIGLYAAGAKTDTIKIFASTSFPEVAPLPTVSSEDIAAFDFDSLDLDLDSVDLGDLGDEAGSDDGGTTASSYQATVPAGENTLYINALRQLTSSELNN